MKHGCYLGLGLEEDIAAWIDKPTNQCCIVCHDERKGFEGVVHGSKRAPRRRKRSQRARRLGVELDRPLQRHVSSLDGRRSRYVGSVDLWGLDGGDWGG